MSARMTQPICTYMSKVNAMKIKSVHTRVRVCVCVCFGEWESVVMYAIPRMPRQQAKTSHLTISSVNC